MNTKDMTAEDSIYLKILKKELKLAKQCVGVRTYSINQYKWMRNVNGWSHLRCIISYPFYLIKYIIT